MANEWNKALSGLTSGLASIGNAVIDKNAIDKADTDYKAARDKIAKTYSELLDSNNQILEQARNHLGLNKQPAPVVPVTMPDGSVNNFEAGTVDGSAPPVQPVYKDPKQYYQDLMNAYVEGKRVLDNNPMGQANSRALDLYYSMVQPSGKEYEYKDLNGRLVQIDKKTGETREIFNSPKPDERQILSGDERYYTRDGKFYRGYPVYNKTQNKLEFNNEQEVSEKEFKKFEDKQLTTPEKLELKNQYNIQYKMDLKDLGLGPGNKSRSTTPGLSWDPADLKSDMKRYNELSNKLPQTLTEAESSELLNLKSNLLNNLKTNEQGLQRYINELSGLSGKNLNSRVNEISKYAQNNSKIVLNIQDSIKQVVKKILSGEYNVDSGFDFIYNNYLAKIYNSIPEELRQSVYDDVAALKKELEKRRLQ